MGEQFDRSFSSEQFIKALVSTPTNLSEAVKQGDLPIVENYIKSENRVEWLIKEEELLQIAASFGRKQVIEYLLEAGANCNVQSVHSQRTPLHEACIFGNVETVKMIIKRSNNLEVTDRDGFTAVHICANQGQLGCLKALAEAGAVLNAADKIGLLPTHLAAKKGEVEILKFLSEKGLDINATCELGKSALVYAAQFSNSETIKCLLNLGANINKPDDSRRQAIHWAAIKNNLNTLRYLHSCGVNLEIPQNDKKTPAHLAAKYGSIDCLHYLLEQSVNVEAVDIFGNTLIHLACEFGKEDCFSCILRHGGKLNVYNNSGATPKELSRKSGNSWIMYKTDKEDTKCLFCKQKIERMIWERDHPMPKMVSQLSKTSLQNKACSPLGRFEADLRQRSRQYKKERTNNLKALNSVAPVVDRRGVVINLDYLPPKARPSSSHQQQRHSSSLTSSPHGQGYRELLAKYNNKYLHNLG